MNLQKIIVPERIENEEILDRDDVPVHEVVDCFDDLKKVNLYFGGIGVYKKTLLRVICTYKRENPISLLDVGAGSADMAHQILKRYNSEYKKIKVTVTDIQSNFLQLGKQLNSNDDNRFSMVASDAFRLPFRDNSFDIVTSNLLLHHFYDDALNMIHEKYRVARHLVIINDLLRHRIPILFFKLFSPVLARSPITRYDGNVSLRRSFSMSEIRRLLESSNYSDYYFVRHWSFRFGLVLWKKRW